MNPNNQEKDVDQLLDAVLAQYGKAEPRAGLETRVLANLRAERDRIASRHRWWWAGIAVATAAIAVAVWLGHGDGARTPGISPSTVARHENRERADHPAVHPDPQPRVTQQAKEAVHRRPIRPEVHNPQAGEAAKLEQFPAPAELSDQEKLLARYVQEFPQRAALIARAQTDLRERNELEMAAPWPNKTDANGLEPQER